MNDEQSRTFANNGERPEDHEYKLTIEEAADLYMQSGHSRTVRAIQKYCAVSKLDCRKVETELGEKYLVAPYSVMRHIAYIDEVTPAKKRQQPRTDTNVREHSRTDANVRVLKTANEQPRTEATNADEQPRTDTNVREHSPSPDGAKEFAVFEHPYVKRLEADVVELKGKYERQIRRTEEVLESANQRLIDFNKPMRFHRVKLSRNICCDCRESAQRAKNRAV